MEISQNFVAFSEYMNFNAQGRNLTLFFMKNFLRLSHLRRQDKKWFGI